MPDLTEESCSIQRGPERYMSRQYYILAVSEYPGMGQDSNNDEVRPKPSGLEQVGHLPEQWQPQPQPQPEHNRYQLLAETRP